MLEFSEEFFAAEVREDFLVDETMKTVWAAELEVLQEIAMVCDRHHLKWYAGYGTLLGAVRHGGFVPWDDDMDIWMLREDYGKLLRVLAKELPKGYRVQSCLHEGYTEYHTAVLNATSISISTERMQRFHGCPFVVGVDIFPLDYLPRKERERSTLETMFFLTQAPASWLKHKETREEKRKEIEEALGGLEDIYRCKIDKTWIDEKPEILSSFLYKKMNSTAMTYREKDGDCLVVWANYLNWRTQIFQKKWFREMVALPYEEFMVPAPKEYDAVLRVIYGDYTIRRKMTATHDYPGYKKQLEQLREEMDRIEGLNAKIEEKMAEKEKNFKTP